MACADCGTRLPEAPPAPPPAASAEPNALSVLLVAYPSPMTAQVAATHLEQAGIPVVITADDCGGIYPMFGPVHGIRLLVKDSDLFRAQEALREIEQQFGLITNQPHGDETTITMEPRPAQPPPTPSRQLAVLSMFLLGGLLGWLTHLVVTDRGDHFTGTTTEDRNGDGRPDGWWVYSNGTLRSGKGDANFDGRVDGWSEYEDGTISIQRDDLDFDGRPDAETRYAKGLLTTTLFASSNKLGFWRRDFFTNGIVRESQLDRNRDGVLDERILFDSFGTFLRRELLK
ncbi:MAG: putative prokaryotic signal transducing protein [Verrucomicrobiota bacterium]